MNIRTGKFSDVAGITDIFNFYIEHTNARFEESPFSLENRQQWFSQFSRDSKYQLYVATENEVLLGFACSQQYRAMTAFEETAEVTVFNEYAKKNGQYISSMWLVKSLNAESAL